MMLEDQVGIKGGKFGKYQLMKDNISIFEPLGNAVYVVGIRQYEEEVDYELVLSYRYNGIQHKHYLRRSNLSRKSLLELSGKGVDAFEHTVGTLIKVIQLQEKEYLENNGEVEYLHKKLGWDDVEVGDETVRVFKHYVVNDEFDSQYIGNYDIKPKGTLEGWVKNMEDEVIGHIPAETVLVSALSSVMVGYLGRNANCENIIIHLVGDSSSGKTTMAYLATATAGNPDISSNSLLRTWGATSNAIITSKAGNYGLVTILDEISMFTGRNLSDLVYKLSTGLEKDRLNKECELKANKSYLTTIFSTGEAGLLAKCNQNTGLKIRVNELEAIWTRSAQNSERIKQNSLKNYGFASVELAKTVKIKGMEPLMERLDYWKNTYKAKTKVNEFADRMSIKYGIIMLTAELTKETFDFKLNLNGILDFLVENEYKNSNNRDIALEAYEKLVDYIHMHHRHFNEFVKNTIKAGNIKNVENTDLWGKLECVRKKELYVNGNQIVEEVSLYRQKFKDIIQELGYEDDKILLEKFKQKGFLNCENGRFYRKRKMQDSGTVERVYVINVFDEEADPDQLEEEKSNKKKKRAQPKINDNVKNLLLDNNRED